MYAADVISRQHLHDKTFLVDFHLNCEAKFDTCSVMVTDSTS